ncbi:MAG: CHAD domain-containing protein [Pseudomonadota bacterium]
MERELKVLSEPAALARLAKHPMLVERAEGGAKRTLTSIYFDTADRHLAKQGMALRIRRKGRSWEQTLKHQRQALSAGLSTPEELSFPVRHPQPDLDHPDLTGLLETARSHLQGHVPGPVFETRIERRLWVLDLPQGRVEIVLDSGEIAAGTHLAPIHEVEIELVSGGLEAVYAAAQTLFDDGPLQFSPLSKAARGFLLADGKDDLPPLAPRLAGRARYPTDATVETAMRDVLRDCLAQIAENAVVIAADDAPEGPHQLRVGLRRLRTALGLFKEGPRTLVDGLASRARALAGLAGAQRDLDVLIDEIAAPILASLADGAAERALTDALVAQRAKRRAELRAMLAKPETTAFILDLAAFIETRGWLDRTDWSQTRRLARPIRGFGTERLDRRFAKLRRRGRTLATATIEDRHALRKELKKLRYTTEFLRPVWGGKRARGFSKAMKSLQDGFGRLNDAATAQTLLSGADAPGAGDPDAQRAAGFVLGVVSARMEAELARFDALWAQFETARPFWR